MKLLSSVLPRPGQSGALGRQPWAALLLLAGLGLLAWAAPAHAEDDPPGRVGRVAEARGQVWMLDPEKREWFDLQRNRPFTTGDRIATDRDARVELQIGSTTVRLDGRTELSIARLDDDRIDLNLISGSVAVRVREPELIRELSLQSGEMNFLPRSTGLFRLDHSARGAVASVFSGEWQVSAREVRLDLRPGQRAELWLDPTDRRLQSAWSQLADDDFERYVRYEDAREPARSEANAGRQSVSPEMTGSRELDRYGRWEQHPEYGSIWSPTVVAVDWAPYRYGHWVWMVRWGWTWVDDAPWGFAPFHYGRWVNWGGRWCWAPGSYVRRPVYAPAMVAWVGGSHVSMSVSIGNAPMVGWIPLAPREVYYPGYVVSPVYVQNINITHVHLPPEQWRQPAPGRPTMYTNNGVPGGVTMVSSQVLTGRQPVGQAPRAADDVVARAINDSRTTIIGAPAANGRVQPMPVNSALGRGVQAVQPGVMPSPTSSPTGRPGYSADLRAEPRTSIAEGEGRGNTLLPAWRVQQGSQPVVRSPGQSAPAAQPAPAATSGRERALDRADLADERDAAGQDRFDRINRPRSASPAPVRETPRELTRETPREQPRETRRETSVPARDRRTDPRKVE